MICFFDVFVIVCLIVRIGVMMFLCEFVDMLCVDYLYWVDFDKLLCVVCYLCDGVIELMFVVNVLLFVFKYVNGYFVNVVCGMYMVMVFGVFVEVDIGYLLLFVEFMFIIVLCMVVMLVFVV